MKLILVDSKNRPATVKEIAWLLPGYYSMSKLNRYPSATYGGL